MSANGFGLPSTFDRVLNCTNTELPSQSLTSLKFAVQRVGRGREGRGEHVDVTALERRRAGAVVGDHPELDRVEVGRALLHLAGRVESAPVVRVAVDGEGAVRLPRAEHERPGADRVARALVLRVQHRRRHHVGGRAVEVRAGERRERLLEIDLDGHVVERLGAAEDGAEGQRVEGAGQVGVEVVDHGLRVERGAVLELHARAQLDHPLGEVLVGDPAGRQPRLGPGVGAGGGQRLEDGRAHEVAGVVPLVGGRVPAGGLGGDAHHEGATRGRLGRRRAAAAASATRGGGRVAARSARGGGHREDDDDGEARQPGGRRARGARVRHLPPPPDVGRN